MLSTRLTAPIIAALLVIMSVYAGHIHASGIDYDRFKSLYSTHSLTQLRSEGTRCIQELKPDSAIAFHALAAARYTPDMPIDEKEECAAATINIGYVWLIMHNNPEQAYPWIMKGIEICRREDILRFIPVADNYLAQIYNIYGDEHNAMKLFKNAFHSSLETTEWWSIIMMYTDLLTYAWQNDKLPEIAPEIELFDRLQIPADIPLSEFSVLLHKGMKAMIEKDYTTAQRNFEAAEQANNAVTGKERGSAQNTIFLADAYIKAGQHAIGIELLKKAGDMIKTHQWNDLAVLLYNMYVDYYSKTGCSEEAEHYRMLSLTLRDSLFSTGRFSRIKDIETSFIVNRFGQEIRTIERDRDTIRNNLILISIGTLIVLISLAIAIYKNNRLKNANHDLYRKNLEIFTVTQNHAKDIQPASMTSGAAILDKQKLENIHIAVIDVFENSAEIYDPDFSIDRLAQLVESLPKYVSYAINTTCGKDFRNLLAEYRIRKACMRLAEEAVNKKFTISAIAGEVGYRSRTHFSKIFKDIIGLTPGQYYKESQRDQIDGHTSKNKTN